MAETIDIRELNERIERQSAFVTNLTTGMDQVIVGQKHLVESLLIGLLSDGHVLLEGVPGLAKTLAIKTLASLIDAQYSRIQFTPDLLPADVIGTMVYSQKDETFQVKKGPVFANFVLADEINRAPAKTQAALFEVMEELASSAKNFKSFSEWFVHIEEYTQQLKEQAKKQVSEKKGITISTLHSIKGLEFDAVFLMDVNEGSLPYHKAVTESSIEEERRLFYVGITRARKFLWILYAKNRHEKELEVSRFLTESGLVLKEEKDKKK